MRYAVHRGGRRAAGRGAGRSATAGAEAAKKPRKRDVLVVSNNWAGTADLVDPHKLKRIKRLNVVPDKAARIAEIEADPTAKFYYDSIRALVGEGHDQYVDDGFVSRNGRVVFFSRPSFADVVAIDIRTNEIRWRTHVDGYRADHMALSPDGGGCSSPPPPRAWSTCSTRGPARSSDTIASGDSPHESNFSRDGTTIFHASIGTVYTDTDDPALDATKGERVFEIIDAETLEVIEAHRHAREDGRVRAAGHERGGAADGDLARRALRLLPALVLPRLRGVRPARGPDHARDRPAAQPGLRGHAARGLRARLGPPRAGDEPEGHEALRGRDDVRLRGDREARPARAAADGPGRQDAVLVGRRARTASTASSPSRATTASP